MLVVTCRPSLCALVLVLGVSAVSAAALEARAEDKKKDNTVETAWTVTVGDEVVGTETLRTVVSESGNRFGATTYKPADKKKKAEALVSHLQRNPDGTLRRYRRAVDVRKGEEIIAFSRPEGVRIVGKNSKRKPAEVPGAQSYMLWDPMVWAVTWEWVRGRKPGGPVTLSVLDVPKGRTGKITLTPDGAFALYDAKSRPVEAQSWVAEVGGEPLRLFVDAKGAILAAKRGDRAMIRAGWSWKQAEKAPQAPEGEGSQSEGDPEQDPDDPTTRTAPEDRAAP